MSLDDLLNAELDKSMKLAIKLVRQAAEPMCEEQSMTHGGCTVAAGMAAAIMFVISAAMSEHLKNDAAYEMAYKVFNTAIKETADQIRKGLVPHVDGLQEMSEEANDFLDSIKDILEGK